MIARSRCKVVCVRYNWGSRMSSLPIHHSIFGSLVFALAVGLIGRHGYLDSRFIEEQGLNRSRCRQESRKVAIENFRNSQERISYIIFCKDVTIIGDHQAQAEALKTAGQVRHKH